MDTSQAGALASLPEPRPHTCGFGYQLFSREAGREGNSTAQLWPLLHALAPQQLPTPLSHTAFPLRLKTTRSLFFPLL